MLDMEIRTNYSPDVQLWLEAQGRSLPLAKIGPDHIVPASFVELRPGDGQIVMTVNGTEDRWDIRIIEAACIFKTSVKVEYKKRQVHR